MLAPGRIEVTEKPTIPDQPFLSSAARALDPTAPIEPTPTTTEPTNTTSSTTTTAAAEPLAAGTTTSIDGSYFWGMTLVDPLKPWW